MQVCKSCCVSAELVANVLGTSTKKIIDITGSKEVDKNGFTKCLKVIDTDESWAIFDKIIDGVLVKDQLLAYAKIVNSGNYLENK